MPIQHAENVRPSSAAVPLPFRCRPRKTAPDFRCSPARPNRVQRIDFKKILDPGGASFRCKNGFFRCRQGNCDGFVIVAARGDEMSGSGPPAINSRPASNLAYRVSGSGRYPAVFRPFGATAAAGSGIAASFFLRPASDRSSSAASRGSGTGSSRWQRRTLSSENVSAEHAALRRQAEEHLADGLEMDRAALALLGAGVDVAQAALERVLVEDRCRAGRTIDRGDDIARLVDRPGRRKPQPDVLVVKELALALGFVPHLGQGLVDKGARGAQPRLALRDLRLDHVVLAQGAAGAARDLVAGRAV